MSNPVGNLFANMFELRPPDEFEIAEVIGTEEQIDNLMQESSLYVYRFKDSTFLLTPLRSEVENELRKRGISYKLRRFKITEIAQLSSRLLSDSFKAMLERKQFKILYQKLGTYDARYLAETLPYSNDLIRYNPGVTFRITYLLNPYSRELLFFLVLDFRVYVSFSVTLEQLVSEGYDPTSEYMLFSEECSPEETSCSIHEWHGKLAGRVVKVTKQETQPDALQDFRKEHRHVATLANPRGPAEVFCNLLVPEPTPTNLNRYAKHFENRLPEDPMRALRINTGDLTPSGSRNQNSSSARWENISKTVETFEESFEFTLGGDVKLIKDPVMIAVESSG